MKEISLLLKLVGDAPLFKIIDFLIENKGLDFTKKNIISAAGISRSTLFNYWDQLERYNIVKITRKFGKTKLYTLNATNPLVKNILDLELAMVKTVMDAASKKSEILVEN
ncbi:hypothetical protein HY498_03855 [Candidatus Woesearchaeota archaeon]|nr:hypothetical protein [Candidatus Woesearchaeota archaeon]